MTLVLGHASPDIGFLIADTLLTFRYTQYDPRNPEIEKFYALKIQILTPEVAVAFAGDVPTSLAILGALHGELADDPELNVPQRILDLRRELAIKTNGALRGDCEFLALLLGSGQKQLVHVDSDRARYVQRAYIGDPDEHAHLTSLLEPYTSPEVQSVQNADGTFSEAPLLVTAGEKEFGQVSDALERLTHQRRSQTVGAICGCITRVVDARISGKLEYLQSVETSISPWEGDGGFSLLAANTGTRGIGLYYRGWRNGLVFVVGDAVPCHKEAAATIDEFVEIARAKYGLRLEGGMW